MSNFLLYFFLFLSVFLFLRYNWLGAYGSKRLDELLLLIDGQMYHYHRSEYSILHFEFYLVLFKFKSFASLGHKTASGSGYVVKPHSDPEYFVKQVPR